MSKGVQQTPITHRLQQLRMEWFKAMEAPYPPRVARWYVLQDEQRMVQAFMELESSEHGEVPDLFIRFNAPFQNKELYSAALINELVTRFREDTETIADLEKDGIDISWNPDWDEKKGRSAISGKEFFIYLTGFLDSIPDFDGRLVLYLTPDEIEDYEGLEHWIMALIESGVPQRLMFSLVDCTTYNWFNNLAKAYPVHVVTLRPELKMYEAVKQMATAGNLNDPDVQFRSCFFQLQEAAAQKKLDEMERCGEKAISITRKFNWPQLESLIYITMGGNFLQFNKVDVALESYEKALKISQDSYKEGKAEAGPMVVQALICKGAGLEVKGKISLAVEAYSQAGAFAAETGDWFKGMEGHRLAGTVLEDNGFSNQAMQEFIQALEYGKKLPDETRQQSTFILLADSMSSLGEKIYESTESEILKKELEVWAGIGWEEKAITLKTEKKHAGLHTI